MLKILQSIDQMGVGGIQEHIKLLAEYSMHQHAVSAHMGLIGEEMKEAGFWVGTALPPDVETYDIVQAHTVGGWPCKILEWGKEHGLKTIEVMHSNAKSITPPEWVDVLVCLNGVAYNLNKNHFKKVVTIPCMVEYDKLPKKPGGALIGRLSRVVEEKRPDHFIEVAKKCPDLNFVLGGEGSMLEELRGKAPSNVKFAGLVRDFADFYKDLKVFLYPTKDDCCSAVMAMAMASGIPVITYDIPSMRDVFGDWAWYAQGLDDLHLVLRHVLGWNQQVQDKVDVGLEFAKKFDVWHVSRQFDRLYVDLYGKYDEKTMFSYWDLRVWEFMNTPYNKTTSFNVSPSHVPGAQSWFKERFAHILSDIKGPCKVLDVGCGIGHYSVPLQEFVPGLLYYGIDTSPMAIRYFEKHFAAQLEQWPTLSLGSADDLSHADSSMDIVMSITCLQHLPAPMRLKAIGEMKRVLRPGGLVISKEAVEQGPADILPFGESEWIAAWGPEIEIQRDTLHPDDLWVGRKKRKRGRPKKK